MKNLSEHLALNDYIFLSHKEKDVKDTVTKWKPKYSVYAVDKMLNCGKCGVYENVNRENRFRNRISADHNATHQSQVFRESEAVIIMHILPCWSQWH